MALVPFPGSKSGALQNPIEPQEDEAHDPSAMSFLEHLDELRKRIVNAVLAVFVGVIGALFFHQQVYDFVFEPTRRVLPEGAKLVYTEPSEAFSLHIQIALIAGIILAAPVIMYQVWKFIAPGLYSNEKKFAIPFVLFSTIGFVGGAAFSHFVVFPFTIGFFGSFNSADLSFMPRVEPIFSLYIKFVLAMGVVFQMPTVVFFLAKMKVVTAHYLARQFKYAILIIFIAAAIITPSPDPGTQTIVAAPMIGLYILSIGIAWLVGPKRKKIADDI